jgi:hypothetical protein
MLIGVEVRSLVFITATTMTFQCVFLDKLLPYHWLSNALFYIYIYSRKVRDRNASNSLEANRLVSQQNSPEPVVTRHQFAHSPSIVVATHLRTKHTRLARRRFTHTTIHANCIDALAHMQHTAAHSSPQLQACILCC